MDKLTLNVDGMNAEMKNSQIDIHFNKDGKAESLKYQGKELLNNLQGETGDPDRFNSFYCDYHMDGKTVNIKPAELKVLEDTEDIKHIAYIDNTSKLGVEYHFILKSDTPVIYSYVKAWNNSNEIFKVNEFRTVYRLDHSKFYIGYNGKRTGMQPTSAHMLKSKKIQDETFDMIDGSLYTNSSIYSKYDYAGYFKDTDFWGQYGDKYGFWFIPIDKSYYGSGPQAQDLMVHYDAIILNYMASEHFGRDMFNIPIGWQKIYGPWCIYINNGNKEDAKNRAQQEENKWPFNWVKDPDYKTNLCSLSGNILSDYSAENYMVVLADDIKKCGPIIQQKANFVYYTQTSEDGKFEVNNIRPGTYYVYAYGINGDDLGVHFLKKLKITKDTNLTNLKIVKQENTIWQIGKASGTTDNLKFSDQLRNYIWQDLVPTNLDYTVGESKDWYYLQNNKGNWNIHFSKNKQYSKNIILQLAFAGITQKEMTASGGVRVTIYLNGKLIEEKNFNNDRAAYRSALKGGAYHYWVIPIDSQLINTENTITINTNGYIMYDSIRMSQKKVQ